ncbi:MAG: rimM [Conexibacter sp.]|nr:rimM [Conexibacter sp.]
MAGSDPAAGGELIGVGRVGRPHGLDGSFHVTQPRERVLNDAVAVIVGGQEIAIVRHDGTPARPILKLQGVATRAAVEALRGAELLMRRADAPPLEDEEWYAEDLVGCRVVDGEQEVGVVARLLPYPSCELLEVQRPDTDPDRPAKALLIPLISDAVRTVDVSAQRIDVNLAFLGDAV